MPLLQQMTQNSPAVDDGKGKNATDLTDHHQMSSQPAKFGVDQPTKDSDDARLANESTEEINSEGDAFLDSFSYSVQELLCKKKRNQKSTQAQCYFSVRYKHSVFYKLSTEAHALTFAGVLRVFVCVCTRARICACLNVCDKS